MKRILLVLIPVFVILVAGLLVGPSFFDWNKYKPEIAKQVKTLTGYDIAINGDISLSLIPSPTAKIEKLEIRSPKAVDPILTMDRADVAVALAPLMAKKIEVESVRLVAPVIQLLVMKDGTQTWMSDEVIAMTKAKEVTGTSQKSASNAAGNIALNRIEIKDGKVAYRDASKGQDMVVESINSVLKAKSLNGPFAAEGNLSYQNKSIVFDVASGVPSGSSGALPVQVRIDMPAAGSGLKFSGIFDKAGQEVQGETTLESKNLGALAQVLGGSVPVNMQKDMSLTGLLTANPDRIQIDTLSLMFGDTKATGKAAVQNLKSKNPVRIVLSLNSDSVVDLGNGSNASSTSGKDTETASKEGLKEIIPATLELPMAIDADIDLAMAGLRANGQSFKGVTANISKTSPEMGAKVKIIELAGKGSLNSDVTITYAASSVSPSKGTVIYTDPSMAFAVSGRIDQVPAFASAMNISSSPALNAIHSSQFDLRGHLDGTKIVLKDSSLKIDETNTTISGYYKPAAGRPRIGLNVAADTLNIDKFMPAAKPADNAAQAAPASPEKALEPLKSFSLPYDADFDISIQKATYQGKPVEGIRAQGSLVGSTLTIKQAWVNSFKGASASLSGSIGDLRTLSDLNIEASGKTGNVRELLQSMNVKVDNLPQQIGTADAAITAKGTVEALAFTSSVNALNGTLKAAGTLQGALSQSPKADNIVLGISHPNFLKAMQIVNPSFKGGSGLEQSFDVNAKVAQDGKVTTLSDIRAMFGKTPITGTLTVDTGQSKPTASGALVLGVVPLDSFLGVPQKQAAGGSAAGGGGSAGRWSTSPIDVSWLNTANLDLSISAKAIQYGAWNFTEPKTTVKMAAGTLDLGNMSAGLFGGAADLAVKISQAEGGALSAAIVGDLKNVAVEQLVTALSGSNKLKAQGDVSLDVSVQTTGTSQSALVNGLNGTANLQGRTVTMEGFDLGKLARALAADIKPGDSLSTLTEGLRGGTTQIDTIDGQYAIQNGIVNITSMVMEGPETVITSRGNASLPKWYIDTVHTIGLKNGAEDFKSFDVTIKGPLDNPGNTFGKGIVEDYLKRKLERKLQKELQGVVQDKLQGTKLGDTLKQLGIGGTQPTAQPQPAQQVPATAPQAAPQPAQQPVQQPAQQPAQQKPASPLDGVLNENDPTEKAIKGVLDGLLQ